MIGARRWWGTRPTVRVGGVRLTILAISLTIAVATLFSVGVTAESNTKRTIRVTVTCDGGSWEYVSSQPTVGAILREAGIALGEKDIVKPAPGVKATNGMKVRVIRVSQSVLTQREQIAFRTVTKFDPYGKSGKQMLSAGVSGEKEVQYLVTYKDGVKTSAKVLGAKVIKQPVNEVVSMTAQTFLSSRAGSYNRSLTMVATAYDPGPRSCGPHADGYTANGTKATKGVVAVDPRVIRLGTRLYVEGYGLCIAADTGGAIHGSRIDLCFDTYSEAIRYGRRVVKVYILD